MKYKVTLKLYTYDWSKEPAAKMEISKPFICESWDAAKDLIGLMADSTNSLSIDIDRMEDKANE